MKIFTRGNIARTSLLLAVALSGNSQLAALHGQEQDQLMMLKPWGGPYGGVPPWNLVRPHAFPEAFATAIAQADQEIAAIAEQSDAPSFANTLVPLESAGRALERLEVLLGVHASNLNLGPIPDVERVVSPQLAAFRDRITQNEKLFSRVATIYENRSAASLSSAQLRLLEDRYKSFVRRGARLAADDKARLSQINQRLAQLYTDFSQNLLADEQNHITWIENADELSGLPPSVVNAMARAAAEHGRQDAWAVTNTRSAMDPFLTYADHRPHRETVWRTYYNRGDNGDNHDNNAIISEILKLRAVRAQLLGYPTHAHWRLEPQMAKTPQAAMDLLLKVWPKAVARVREEVADMQTLAHAEDTDLKIAPWDYRYFAEKVRKQKYDLDFNEVKPYLQFEKLREAMFWVAGELFGLQFKSLSDLPVFHPDVHVWEVLDRKGQHLGLWYLDPFAREGKRSGAWMTSYRAQENLGTAVSPIVSNNSNFVAASEGETVLISWDDAETLFHEFGHALHGLCSHVNYPSQSGTSVARDYVEFPSQIFEHWLSTSEVLNRFAVHYQTGQPLPAELLEKIKRAATFNEGFNTVEYLASALIDMRLHLAGETEINPDAFERETLAELGMPAEIVMRHRTPQFAHIFSGDGYSAGYYSYLWADALTADAAEVFTEAGGFYDPAIAQRLYDEVLSVGDTVDPETGFRAFRGRDVDTDALLRKRGFPVD